MKYLKILNIMKATYKILAVGYKGHHRRGGGVEGEGGGGGLEGEVSGGWIGDCQLRGREGAGSPHHLAVPHLKRGGGDDADNGNEDDMNNGDEGDDDDDDDGHHVLEQKSLTVGQKVLGRVNLGTR